LRSNSGAAADKRDGKNTGLSDPLFFLVAHHAEANDIADFRYFSGDTRNSATAFEFTFDLPGANR
jgi:hypothetical protein